MSKIKVPGYSFPHFSHSSWLSNGHLLKAPSSGPHLILITTTPTPPLPSTITWDGGWLEHQCMNLVWDRLEEEAENRTYQEEFSHTVPEPEHRLTQWSPKETSCLICFLSFLPVFKMVKLFLPTSFPHTKHI